MLLLKMQQYYEDSSDEYEQEPELLGGALVGGRMKKPRTRNMRGAGPVGGGYDKHCVELAPGPKSNKMRCKKFAPNPEAGVWVPSDFVGKPRAPRARKAKQPVQGQGMVGGCCNCCGKKMKAAKVEGGLGTRAGARVNPWLIYLAETRALNPGMRIDLKEAARYYPEWKAQFYQVNPNYGTEVRNTRVARRAYNV